MHTDNKKYTKTMGFSFFKEKVKWTIEKNSLGELKIGFAYKYLLP